MTETSTDTGYCVEKALLKVFPDQQSTIKQTCANNHHPFDPELSDLKAVLKDLLDYGILQGYYEQPIEIDTEDPYTSLEFILNHFIPKDNPVIVQTRQAKQPFGHVEAFNPQDFKEYSFRSEIEYACWHDGTIFSLQLPKS